MARDSELIAACARNNLPLAKALLEAGSSPNVRHGFDNSTPLIEAVRANAFSIVCLLLSTEADVNAADRDGWTPLMLAVLAQEDVQMVGALLQSASGIKVNATRKNRESALTLVSAAERECVCADCQWASVWSRECVCLVRALGCSATLLAHPLSSGCIARFGGSRGAAGSERCQEHCQDAGWSAAEAIPRSDG